MPAESILGVMAQLALIICGFSGIVGVVGRRGAGDWTEPDKMRLRVMITSSFRVLFLALLPFPFLHFGLSEAVVWGWCSGVAFVTGALQMALVIKRVRKISADETHSGLLQLIQIAISVLSLMVHLLNTIGVFFGPAFGPYLLGLLLTFITPCINFLRLLETASERN